MYKFNTIVIIKMSSKSSKSEPRMITSPFDMPDLFRGLVIMNHRINVIGILFGIIHKQIIKTSDKNVYQECKYILENLGLYVSFNDTHITIRKQLTDEELDLFRLKKSISDIIFDNSVKQSNSTIKSFSLKIRVFKFKFNYKNGEQSKITVYETINLVMGDNTFQHCVFDYDYANQCLKEYNLKMKITHIENNDIINISHLIKLENVIKIDLQPTQVILDSHERVNMSPKNYNFPINFNEILENCKVKDSTIEIIKKKKELMLSTYKACNAFASKNNYKFTHEELSNNDIKFLFIKK